MSTVFFYFYLTASVTLLLLGVVIGSLGMGESASSLSIVIDRVTRALAAEDRRVPVMVQGMDSLLQVP